MNKRKRRNSLKPCPVCNREIDSRGLKQHVATHGRVVDFYRPKNVVKINGDHSEPVTVDYRQGYRDGWRDREAA